MKVVKEGKVEVLNGVTCPVCGAVYDDVRPNDIFWHHSYADDYNAIRCKYCGNDIEVKYNGT